MKKEILLLTIFLWSTFIVAQDNFATYNNSYFEKTYNIDISLKENDKFNLYIDAYSMDRLYKIGGITVDNKELSSLIDALNNAKLKYQEWVEVAKENSVKDLNKKMNLNSKVGGYFLSGSDWHFSAIVNLTFEFKVTEINGVTKHLLIVRSGEMQSASNQFMKVDGVVLIFSSSEEIDEFISAISIEKIEEFKSKPKTEDLFKD